MFGFFEKLPKEITLEIFSKTSCQDQARLAQVSKVFNNLIVSGKSLELPKYKSIRNGYEIGDVCLKIEKFTSGSYVFILLDNLDNGVESLLILPKETCDKITVAIESDYPNLTKRLIEILTLSAHLILEADYSKFAKILQKESQKEKIYNKLDVKYRSEFVNIKAMLFQEINSALDKEQSKVAFSYSLLQDKIESSYILHGP